MQKWFLCIVTAGFIVLFYSNECKASPYEPIYGNDDREIARVVHNGRGGKTLIILEEKRNQAAAQRRKTTKKVSKKSTPKKQAAPKKQPYNPKYKEYNVKGAVKKMACCGAVGFCSTALPTVGTGAVPSAATGATLGLVEHTVEWAYDNLEYFVYNGAGILQDCTKTIHNLENPHAYPNK